MINSWNRLKKELEELNASLNKPSVLLGCPECGVVYGHWYTCSKINKLSGKKIMNENALRIAEQVPKPKGSFTGLCKECDSSIKRNWLWKPLGCIQPKCPNYWKSNKKYELKIVMSY